MSQSKTVRGWWVAGGAFALIVGLVAVALIRKPVELDPTTPEGTVQAYLQAVADKDFSTAISMIDAESHPDCKPADLAYVSRDQHFTATVGETTISGGIAYVPVTITMGASPGPFDPGRSGYDQQFTLRKTDGGWLITGDAWPYFSWRCDQP